MTTLLPPADLTAVAGPVLRPGDPGWRAEIAIAGATCALVCLPCMIYGAIAVGSPFPESGRATRWGAIRGLRAFPVVFALHVIGVAVVFATDIVAALGGLGLALMIRTAGLVVATWVFAFAPIIAVMEHHRLMECLGRSIRAARMPG